MFRFGELPNIEKAYRRVASWPLVRREKDRTEFKKFAETNLSLTDAEATALTVSTVNLTENLANMVNGSYHHSP